MYNLIGTSFGADVGLDLFSEKVQIREGFLSRIEFQEGGRGGHR